MRILKLGAAIVGALLLTTFAIDASDTLRGRSGTLVANLMGREATACPLGMVSLTTARTFSCVDAFEASAEQNCPFPSTDDELSTIANITDTNCNAESKPNAEPWRFISREQAVLMCARAGKRLPSAAEWYEAAIGTPDNATCVIDAGSPAQTGTHSDCRSVAGIFDAVGNVWEWTNDDVFNGVYANRTLPTEGYVAQVGNDGVASVTAATPTPQFGNDYFWHTATGSFGMMRGGYYASKEDAGVYAVHSKTLPTAIGGAIGFRSVQ